MEIFVYLVLIFLLVVSTIFITKIIHLVFGKINRLKKNEIVNLSNLYAKLLSKFDGYDYNKEKINEYKEILNVEMQELQHAKGVVKSDLDTIGLVTILYTVGLAGLSAFFKLISCVYEVQLQNIFCSMRLNIDLNATKIENFITFYFMIIIMFVLYNNISQYRKQKYLLYLIEDEIEEKKQNQIVYEKNMNNKKETSKQEARRRKKK